MASAEDILYVQLASTSWFKYILPAIGVTLGVGCVVFNAAVGAFFRTKCSNVMHLIYFSLSCCQFGAGIAAIIQGISVVVTSVYPSAQVYSYSIFFIIGQLSFHVSGFLNVLLTVTRSVSIYIPLYILNKSRIITSVCVYTALWLCFILWEWSCILFVRKYQDRPAPTGYNIIQDLFYVYPRPGGIVVDEIFSYAFNGNKTLVGKYGNPLIVVFSIAIPYALPSVICLVCGLTQVYFITQRMIQKKKDGKNRRMYITIIMLTVLFFICNTCYLIIVIIDYMAVSNRSQDELFLLLISSNHLLYLNACLTPAILIIRGASLKQYAYSLLGMTLRAKVTKDAANNFLSVGVTDRHHFSTVST